MLPRQLDKLEFGELFSIGYVGATISRPRAADCRPYNTDYANLNLAKIFTAQNHTHVIPRLPMQPWESVTPKDIYGLPQPFGLRNDVVVLAGCAD